MTGAVASLSVRYSGFGPATVLRVVPGTVPAPADGQVRISVRAAGLNPIDSKAREGLMPRLVPTFPAGIGREVAGVVEAVGADVGSGGRRFAVGDEVFGSVSGGALAEFVLAKPGSLAHKPAGLDWAIAATLPLAGITAWDSFGSQSVTAADTVLVSAAAGGVGVLVAQLAVRAGAMVIGTAGERNHDFLRGIGVIPVAYGPGLADRVRAAAAGREVTVVLDHHGDETVEAGIALGVPLSRINTIAADAAAHGVQGVGRGAVDPTTLESLARLIVEGGLVVPIDSEFPLAEVVAAYDRLDGGHVRGKVVVTVP